MNFSDLRAHKPPGGWALTIQVSFAILTTIALCIWQISRGIEKQDLRTSYVDRLNDTPITAYDFREAESENAYRKIELVGMFDPKRSFVVGYQRHNGLPGYWIITRFDTNAGAFLVNRGWISVTGTWLQTPEFETPPGTHTLTGVVWPIHKARMDDDYDDPEWPKRVKRLNVEQMAHVAGTKAAEIRLYAENPGVFTPVHMTMESSAARHWGYAIQWLIIGALVAGGYWFFAVRRRDEDG